jgi:hypothetical protein
MKKKLSLILIFLFISGSFVTLFSPVSSDANLVGDSWNSKTQMQQARGGLGVVAVDGKIYAIGGKTIGGGFVGSNERYDPKTDTWTTLAPMPTYRAYFAVVVFEDKIYCIGGFGKGGGVCGVNEVYDTVSGSWCSKASLPVSGGSLQGGVVGGKIFVLVGCDLFMYDPVMDRWVQKNSIIEGSMAGSNFAALGVVDDSLIVVGNFSSSSSRNELRVRIYNPQTDEWREGAKPSFEAIGGVVGVTSGLFASKRLYFFGTFTAVVEYPGFSQTYVELRPFVMVYDPVKGVWSSGRASVNRVDFGVAVADDVLYVVGGFSVISEDTVITVGREVPVPGSFHFETYTVYEQVSASRPVIGGATALNMQYVPFGYDGGSVVVSDPPNSGPSGSGGLSWGSFNSFVVVGVLVLIVVFIVAGLVLYFKKAHKISLIET